MWYSDELSIGILIYWYKRAVCVAGCADVVVGSNNGNKIQDDVQHVLTIKTPQNEDGRTTRRYKK